MAGSGLSKRLQRAERSARDVLREPERDHWQRVRRDETARMLQAWVNMIAGWHAIEGNLSETVKAAISDLFTTFFAMDDEEGHTPYALAYTFKYPTMKLWSKSYPDVHGGAARTLHLCAEAGAGRLRGPLAMPDAAFEAWGRLGRDPHEDTGCVECAYVVPWLNGWQSTRSIVNDVTQIMPRRVLGDQPLLTICPVCGGAIDHDGWREAYERAPLYMPNQEHRRAGYDLMTNLDDENSTPLDWWPPWSDIEDLDNGGNLDHIWRRRAA